MALLLLVAAPRFQGTAQRLHDEQTAVELMQLLRYARERAVADGRTVNWVWDADAQRARLESVAQDGTLVWLEGRAARSAPVGGGVSVSLRQDGVPAYRVAFFPDGTSDAASLSVIRGDRAYTVTVDAATGQALLSSGAVAH